MPHTGKPSGACKTCKQRHVRCDESRPGCNRCIKSNRVCPGYAEGLDLVLRDQNEAAKAGVGRRQKAAQRARENTTLNLENRSLSRCNSSFSNSSSPSLSSLEESMKVAKSPSYLAPSEDDYQLCLFVNTWVLYPHDEGTDRGFIELLPFMYSPAKLGSPLALCVAAISSALSAKFVLKMRDVEMPQVRQKYVKALVATREALEHPVESLTDDTLMAVCLLGYYESVIDSFKARVSSPRHFDGAAALIKQRQGRLTTEIGQKILVGVRNSIVYRAVTHGTPLDTTSSIWQDYDPIPHNAATLLDQLSLEIPNLMVAASPKPRKLTGLTDSIAYTDTRNRDKTAILAKAHTIDGNLASWPEKIPPGWSPVRMSAKDVPESIIAAGGIYQDHCDHYQDIMVCATWNSYRVSRLKVLDIIAQISSPASSEQMFAIENLQSLADDICASVPFCMGSRVAPSPLYALDTEYPTLDRRPANEYHHRTAAAFGGWYLFSPMKQVMEVGMWLRPGQSVWMGSQLRRLARVYDVEPEED